jgi:sulfide:quinone oxidoreductase
LLYGGKFAPTIPTWLIGCTRALRVACYLKERLLPAFCWQGNLKVMRGWRSPK